jgi:hypothetical protein
MSSNPDISSARWEKSTYSAGNGGQCLEFARNINGLVPVRDSKDPGGPALILSSDAWTAFVGQIKG